MRNPNKKSSKRRINIPESIKKGQVFYLKVKFTPIGRTNSIVKFKSTNKNILKVDKGGRLVAGDKTGKVNLIAVAGKIKKIVTIKVK